MNALIIAILVTLLVLIVSFIGYTVTTASYIRDQDREIARLKRENKALRSQKADKVEVIYTNAPNASEKPSNVPSFDKW